MLLATPKLLMICFLRLFLPSYVHCTLNQSTSPKKLSAVFHPAAKTQTVIKIQIPLSSAGPCVFIATVTHRPVTSWSLKGCMHLKEIPTALIPSMTYLTEAVLPESTLAI